MTKAVYLTKGFNPRENSITFLRLSLAILVILHHSYRLGGIGQDPLMVFSNGQVSSGSFAVFSFFALSGFLVTKRYLDSSSVWRYLWHRMLKIIPGYWVCLVITAIGIGYINYFYAGSNFSYFKIPMDNPLLYIKANLWLVVEQRGIANLFETNPYPKDINGSLWVLNYLFVCYLSMPILGRLSIFNSRKDIAMGFFLCLWIANVLEKPMIDFLSLLLPQLSGLRVPDLLVYFIAGSTFFLYIERIPFNLGLFLLSLFLATLGLRFQLSNLLLPLTIPYILLWLSIKLPLKGFNRYGDYSYGMFIYAFPVQQTITFWGLNRYGLVIYFGLSILFTLPLAIMSWWAIEKPCLRWRSLTLPELLPKHISGTKIYKQ